MHQQVNKVRAPYGGYARQPCPTTATFRDRLRPPRVVSLRRPDRRGTGRHPGRPAQHRPPRLLPEIDPARAHITLIDRSPALLASFHPALRDYTRRQMANRGVEVRLGAAIAEITPARSCSPTGPSCPAMSRCGRPGWPRRRRSAAGPAAGGRRPHRTGPDLRVAGQDRIFAVGDIAVTDGQPLPQLAQPALQMGRHAADQIRRLEAGQPTVPFRYRDKGIMATIGYRSAVVQLPRGVRVRGTPAWLALHLITLLGGRNRGLRIRQPVLALPHLAARRRPHPRRRPRPAGPGPLTRPAASASYRQRPRARRRLASVMPVPLPSPATVAEMNHAPRRIVELQASWITNDRSR
jgi:Pyridine nucleotide-disulphide oxidoreductase